MFPCYSSWSSRRLEMTLKARMLRHICGKPHAKCIAASKCLRFLVMLLILMKFSLTTAKGEPVSKYAPPPDSFK